MNTSQATQLVTFQFGAALDADDPLARWISSLAMAHNDLVQVHTLYVANPDGGEGIYFVRLAAGHLSEIGDPKAILGAGHDDWPEVQAFVAGLPESTRDDFARLKHDLLDRTEHSIGWQIDQVRHRVFHYPHLHSGQSLGKRLEITRALRALADEEGTISVAGGTVAGTRLGFADELALSITLERANAASEPDLQRFVERVADLQMRFLRFAQVALWRYFAGLPEGTVTVPDAP